jgi:ribosomal protein L28
MDIKKIFKKFQSDLMKRAFNIEDEGSCVRLSVAERVLRDAIEECCDVEEETTPVYGFGGQEVRGL